MPIYQAIVLGIIQGLTEFLPVSSSAHLALAPWLFGWKDQGLAFDIAMHFGTLVSVLLFFIRDWVQIIGQAFGLRIGNDPFLRDRPKMLWYLMAASIPAGLAGLLLEKKIETTFRSAYVIGVMAIVIGLVMLLAEFFGAKLKHIGTLSFMDTMTMGIAQALAVIPGTSRSGVTMAAGLFRDLDRGTAARVSFLMSTPIIAGAALHKAWDLHKEGGLPAEMREPFIVGTIVSAVTGALVIGLFLRYLRASGLQPFVAYRILFGIAVIALAMFRGFQG